MRTKSLFSALALGAAVFAGGSVAPNQAQAQEAFIGEIRLFGFNFCPRGWADAAGQLLPINQNTALFSLYGTIYGGDGRTTFGLPDLRGRAAVNYGNGPGLSNRPIGQKTGSETTVLSVAQMPSHNHAANATLYGTTESGNNPSPAGKVLADDGSDRIYKDSPASVVAMGSESVSVTVGNQGGGQAVSLVQPILAMNYCVNLFGIFPSRN